VAQLGARFHGMEEVVGSIPTRSTSFYDYQDSYFCVPRMGNEKPIPPKCLAMRMWMVSPKLMCRQHLLGEHVELHMLVACLKREFSIQGYVDQGLVNTRSIYSRHDALVAEMTLRGYKHQSPLHVLRKCPKVGKISRAENLKELARRCPGCRQLQSKSRA
jgi:Pyrimidine dimer DNA glycosylase